LLRRRPPVGRRPSRPRRRPDARRSAVVRCPGGDVKLIDRLTQLYESASTRDAVEVAILAVALFVILRLLGKAPGAGIVRGLGLLLLGLFLIAQVVIASFDLRVLGRVLDYLLTTVTLGLLVIFQPELRRGLMLLGRYRVLRYFTQAKEQ